MPELILPPAAPLATADHPRPAGRGGRPPTTDLATPLDQSPAGAGQSPAAVYLAQLAKSGRRTQHQALNRLAGLLGYPDAFHCPWHQLRYQHTAALRTTLAELYAPSMANKVLAALRRVLKECWQLGLMTVEEYERAANVKAIKAQTLPKGRALSLDELAQLLQACAVDATPAGVRDAALIALMAAGGPRRSEVVALELRDYDRADGRLIIRWGKGKKDRTIYVSGGAQVTLDDWLTLRGSGPGPIFTSTTHPGRGMTDQAVLVILQKRALEAGVAPFSPHDLRRTMITRLLDAGADMISVQRLAGHADPATTARYDRRGEHAKKEAAAKVEIPHVPNVARRTLPLGDPGPAEAG
jgi:integrase/recombinase XerD